MIVESIKIKIIILITKYENESQLVQIKTRYIDRDANYSLWIYYFSF